MPLTQVPNYPISGLDQSVLGNGGAPATVPASGTATIFTTFGVVEIVRIMGVITTAIGSTATTLKISANVGGLGSVDVCAAGTITSLAIGQLLMPITSFATALPVASPTTLGVEISNAATQWMMSEAGIITCTTSATPGGGAIQWYCRYRPMSNGAYVQ